MNLATQGLLERGSQVAKEQINNQTHHRVRGQPPRFFVPQTTVAISGISQLCDKSQETRV